MLYRFMGGLAAAMLACAAQAATDAPSGYTKCAQVGASCTMTGTRSVALGKSGSFVYANLTGTFTCKQSLFPSNSLPDSAWCSVGPVASASSASAKSSAASSAAKSSVASSAAKSSAASSIAKSSAAASVASSAKSSTPPATGKLLPQSGNPVQTMYNQYKTMWSADKAENVLSFQLTNGGWPKNQVYDKAGKGGNEAGTIDNKATTSEMAYLAMLYNSNGNIKYRDAVRKGADFLLSAQYSTGAWPQFFPLKGGYADHATYNDNAMIRTLMVMDNIANKGAPFDTDVVTDAQRVKAKAAVAKGVEYILKSQWKQNGKLTVWCAQHGATDYKPKAARAYELESLSGSESTAIIGFLMTQPQTPEIAAAVKSALDWFRSPLIYLADTYYDKNVEKKFVSKAGSKTWYRFYKLDTNKGFFSDRDGKTYYDIMEISEERRNGYSWGGSYGDAIIAYASSVGY